MLAGYYALQEITAVLDTQLVTDPLGSAIMDKLRSCTGKATAPCSGIQFEVQTNPMKPYKSVVWKRCSVPEPGRAVEAEDAEDVPYVLLYFTVSHTFHNRIALSACPAYMVLKFASACCGCVT